jgi:hypothetical protein
MQHSSVLWLTLEFDVVSFSRVKGPIPDQASDETESFYFWRTTLDPKNINKIWPKSHNFVFLINGQKFYADKNLTWRTKKSLCGQKNPLTDNMLFLRTRCCFCGQNEIVHGQNCLSVLSGVSVVRKTDKTPFLF